MGVRQLQHTNVALLSKWVWRLMQPPGDLTSRILQDGYGDSLDWHTWGTPQKGDSAFMSSLRPIFPTVWPFFRPQLGVGESFRFWRDEWTGARRIGQSFPRLFALTPDPECSVRRAWHRAWAPPLPAALSEQRMTNFLRMQEYWLPRRPVTGGNQWIWGGPKFSCRAVYCRLRDRAGSEDQLFSVEDTRLFMASPSPAADDSSSTSGLDSLFIGWMRDVRGILGGLRPHIRHVPDCSSGLGIH